MAKNPTVKEIVKEYLEKNGYDGLYLTDDENPREVVCFCYLGDFINCGQVYEDCRAGHDFPSLSADEIPGIAAREVVEPEKEGK